MSKQRWFILGGLSFVAGIAYGDFFSISIWFFGGILFIGSVLFIFFRKQFFLPIIFFGLLFFLLGFLRIEIADRIFLHESFVGNAIGESYQFTGTISREPDIRDTHQKITLSKIETHSESNFHGKILLLSGLENKYSYGDVLSFRCTLEQPQSIDGFDYARYLSRFSVFAICPFPVAIEFISESQSFLTHVFSLKNIFHERLIATIPQPHASFLLGILLGERRGLGEALSEIFQRVGLTHIVALSGFNIAIIAGALLFVGRSIGIHRKILFYIIVLFVILFVIMTGASSSVTRAAVMGLLVLFAYSLGRLTHPFSLLLFAALVMLIFNPRILVADVGFQLSFVATYAVLTLPPLLSARFSYIPNPYALRDIIFVTFSAIIFTLPLSLYYFQGWSLVAPIANLLVLPFIPLAMLFGFISGILGTIGGASLLWVYPTWLISRYIILVSEFLSSFSLSYITISNFSFVWVLLFYLVLILLVWYFKKRIIL